MDVDKMNTYYFLITHRSDNYDGDICQYSISIEAKSFDDALPFLFKLTSGSNNIASIYAIKDGKFYDCQRDSYLY
jgi:hypothetical protein